MQMLEAALERVASAGSYCYSTAHQSHREPATSRYFREMVSSFRHTTPQGLCRMCLLYLTANLELPAGNSQGSVTITADTDEITPPKC